MRFTAAFISTLFSASTVLAHFSPYAGYQQTNEQGTPDLLSASFKFRVPAITCRLGDIAYAGALLVGDPNVCNDDTRAIEGGVIFTCQANKVVYRPYWQLYPDTVHFGRSDQIAAGDEIRVEVSVNRRTDVVTVNIENPTQRWTFNPILREILRPECRTTVRWFLRTDLTDEGDLKPMPRFSERLELRNVDARNTDREGIGTRQSTPMDMENARGQRIVRPQRPNGDFTTIKFLDQQPPTG